MRFLFDLARALRPGHWTKNFVVFAALIFARKFFYPGLVGRSLLAFASFCLLSSAVYLINDIADRNEDRRHPAKRDRPIAARRISVATAALIAVVLVGLGLALAFYLDPSFLLVAAGYSVLMVLYSFFLRRVVILDVLIISSGFVLRAVGGAVAIWAEISVWLLICTFLLALFLALGKRRHEFAAFADADQQREVLGHYSTALLDQMIAVATASTVVAYSIYTVDPETTAKFHTRNLVFTVPFVLYGVFRYLYLIYRRQEGSNPERLLVNDRPLLLDIFLWVVASFLVLYL